MNNLYLIVQSDQVDADHIELRFTQNHLRQIRDGIAALDRTSEHAQPQGDSASALATLSANMANDPDYAWSWHCNLS